MNVKKVSKSLYPKYWAGRIPIYLFMGIIPLLTGIMYLSLYFSTDESYFQDYKYDLSVTEIESSMSEPQFILEIKTIDKTVNDRLDYDAWLDFLDNYGKPGLRQRVLNTENLKYAFDRIKKESPELKFFYNNDKKKITGLKFNGHTIIFHYNHFLLGFIITLIGLFMIIGSLYMIIKDPNEWYKKITSRSAKSPDFEDD
ncbi:hypothetical protein [Cellulophaga sp. Hel_I_12]|uniref:hypothetical protein n=1 Tax=Cellulophaga sp. Hel_I_12 TaxID=1249972 RepID=UPI0006489746|nr:hypothetical protein [Cellulophaga sp. Hel_I_12]